MLNDDSFVGLLDAVPGAVAAYSVTRKLRAGYSGPLVRLREDAGNTDRDFYANGSGFLDTTVAEAWRVATGATNLFIPKVYDQSGNGFDAVQATAGNQPKYAVVGGRAEGVFDGATTFWNMYSAGFAAAFNPLEGTIISSAKFSGASAWTDGVQRFIENIGVNGSNGVILDKSVANNTLRNRYIAGGVTDTVTTTSLGGDLGFLDIGICWKKLADLVRAYAKGIQFGSDQSGLGVWTGSLSSSACVIGASSTIPGSVWSGSIRDNIIWTRQISNQEVATVHNQLSL